MKQIMRIDDKIKDGKLQYNTNREASKISKLLSGKIDKYEYLAYKEILPSDQNKIIEQVKFTYCLFGRVFEKQKKKTTTTTAAEDQGIKQVEALKSLKSQEKKEDIKSIEGLFPQGIRTNEI